MGRIFAFIAKDRWKFWNHFPNLKIVLSNTNHTKPTAMKSLSFILLFTMLAPVFLFAQEEEKEEVPYWYVMSYKLPWSKMDSMQSLIKKYTLPTVAEAKKEGKVLDYKVFIHHTGDEYNVLIMTKYPSWDAIDDGPGFREAFETLFPDEEEQKDVYGAFQWIFEGMEHFDNIYTELTE
jgi:hypothetical protein